MVKLRYIIKEKWLCQECDLKGNKGFDNCIYIFLKVIKSRIRSQVKFGYLQRTEQTTKYLYLPSHLFPGDGNTLSYSQSQKVSNMEFFGLGKN